MATLIGQAGYCAPKRVWVASEHDHVITFARVLPKGYTKSEFIWNKNMFQAFATFRQNLFSNCGAV